MLLKIRRTLARNNGDSPLPGWGGGSMLILDAMFVIGRERSLLFKSKGKYHCTVNLLKKPV